MGPAWLAGLAGPGASAGCRPRCESGRCESARGVDGGPAGPARALHPLLSLRPRQAGTPTTARAPVRRGRPALRLPALARRPRTAVAAGLVDSQARRRSAGPPGRRAQHWLRPPPGASHCGPARGAALRPWSARAAPPGGATRAANAPSLQAPAGQHKCAGRRSLNRSQAPDTSPRCGASPPSSPRQCPVRPPSPPRDTPH